MKTTRMMTLWDAMWCCFWSMLLGASVTVLCTLPISRISWWLTATNIGLVAMNGLCFVHHLRNTRKVEHEL